MVGVIIIIMIGTFGAFKFKLEISKIHVRLTIFKLKVFRYFLGAIFLFKKKLGTHYACAPHLVHAAIPSIAGLYKHLVRRSVYTSAF